MGPIRKYLEAAFSEEKRYYILAVSLIVLVVAFPMVLHVGNGSWYQWLVAAQLLLTVFVVSEDRKTKIKALSLGIPAIAGEIFQWFVPTEWTIGISAIFGVAFMSYVVLIVFRSVIKEGRITGDRVAGAVAVYILFGMLFAVFYEFIGMLDAAAFEGLQFDISQETSSGRYPDFLYFSFVTMTTLGYGDINPVSPVARSVAGIQAVIGQLYIGITVARMVALQIAHTGMAKIDKDSPEN